MQILAYAFIGRYIAKQVHALRECGGMVGSIPTVDEIERCATLTKKAVVLILSSTEKTWLPTASGYVSLCKGFYIPLKHYADMV